VYKQHPEIRLREDVISTVTALKSLRKKHDTSQSRLFFKKINNIKDYDESGLDQAIHILYTEFTELASKVSKSYMQKVKENSLHIYKLFLKECVLMHQDIDLEILASSDLETIIASPTAVMFKKEAYIIAVNFLFVGVVINDEGTLFKEYNKLINKIEALHTNTKLALFTTSVSIAASLLAALKINLVGFLPGLVISAIMYTAVSLIIHFAYILYYKIQGKKAKATSNLL